MTTELDERYHALITEIKRLGVALEITVKSERAALARIAELESQLAAQAWRPVTEQPTEDDVYIKILISGYWRNGLFRLRSGDEIWDRHVLGWQYTEQ